MTENVKNRLLKRQIKKHFGTIGQDANLSNAFIQSIDNAYTDFEEDHYMLENLLEQNNKELFKLNTELENKVKERTFQLEQQSESLKEVNLKLQQFARVVSHDLKSPLNSINALSYLIEDELKPYQSEAILYIDSIQERVHFMDKLIMGILNYSKISSQDFESKPVNIYELVNSILANITIQGNTKIIINKELPIVLFDYSAMQQVFGNLITNAVKYGKCKNPKIEIGFREISKTLIEFFIKDNGNGISPEDQIKVFDAFYKGRSAENEIPSTGLGLSIVKKILDKQGSTISINYPNNVGTEISFTWQKKLLVQTKL
jgi:signal transduction histidine kinase